MTDCGCFGDFIKLVPRISFYKDLGLLIPAFYFVFRHKDMHQLFTFKARRIIVAASTILLILFCLYNAVWNLPVIDFRPFKVGTEQVLAIHSPARLFHEAQEEVIGKKYRFKVAWDRECNKLTELTADLDEGVQKKKQ